MYEIKNLSYLIQKRKILNNISIDIKSNSFLSVVGPNGCGKSTLMKIINRNIDIQEGTVTLNNKDINSLIFRHVCKTAK